MSKKRFERYGNYVYDTAEDRELRAYDDKTAQEVCDDLNTTPAKDKHRIEYYKWKARQI